ncbi:MAG TPA: MerR family transcriptional regulator [Thermomicrobiales bacterium]|jgi:DNA-binding transcriptional MerR regulator
MGTLLSIGAFSRMTFLSVKALRHYHDVGLLLPAAIDPESGYRRYEASQVPTAQVIRRLRDLGMPLEEVRVVVQAPDVDTRNAAIIAHLHRMERQLQQTQATVASLRNLIEEAPAPIAVEFRAIDPTAALAVRARIGTDEVVGWLAAAFGELRATLATAGGRRLGADAALYSGELLEDERGELVAFVPVEGAVRPSGRVERVILPAVEYAVAVHRGSFDSLDRTYAALGTVVAERAIGVEGPIREDYLVGERDTPDESKHVTEVCWPVFQTLAREHG